jgi:uncharacterized protein
MTWDFLTPRALSAPPRLGTEARFRYDFQAMDIVLNDAETRVLGALMEKESTTPEYYPLSMNALIAACNQKSNRDPVMTLDEGAVRQALRKLETQELAGPANTNDSRVKKFEHRLGEAFNFTRPESAVLCELLLRGPQTPGELRSRAERMRPSAPGGRPQSPLFDSLDQVHSALQHLMKREPPLVIVLPRQPGTKEARYAQVLSGDVRTAAGGAMAAPVAVIRADSHGGAPAGGQTGPIDRLARLEDEVTAIRQEIVRLNQQLADFRKQFE